MSDSTVDLKAMTVPQLTALIEEATATRSDKMEGARAEAREKVLAMAAELGMSLQELMGQSAAAQEPPATRRRGSGKRSSSTGATVAAKYRDPASGKTWSGRGREPVWIKGKDRADFAVASKSD